MGSYHEEKIMAGSDYATAGSLVWVRRRNGSWWPGRVLGLDELPDECSVPPRSGTPIKLLGKEDGSMDWYNLGKSTRVKAFRCGEYDEDIEKAKVSAGNSNKKAPNAGKYVRREDAILHALELESIHTSSESQKSYPVLNNLMDKRDYKSATQPKPASTQSKKPGCMSRKHEIHDEASTQEFSQSIVSFEEPNNPSTTDMHLTQKKRWKTPYDSENDHLEETRRTRGLQDLGLRTVSQKKGSILVRRKGSPLSSKFDNVFSDDIPIKSSKSSFLSLKRKQSMGTHVHVNSKKKSRRRQLTKVLEVNTIEVSACHGSHRSGTSHEGSSLDVSGNTYGGTLDGSSSCSDMEDHDHSNSLEFSGSKCPARPNVPLANGETRDIGCLSGLDASRKFHPCAPRQFCQLSKAGTITHLRDSETFSTNHPIQLHCARHIVGNKKSRLNIKGKRKSKYVTLSKTTHSDGCLDGADQSGTYLMERAGDNKINGTSSDGHLVKYGSSSDDVSDGPQLETSEAADLCHMNSLEQGFANEVHVQSAEDLTDTSYALPFARYSETAFTGDVAVSTVPHEKSSLHHVTICSEYQVSELVNGMLEASRLYDVKLNVERNYHEPHVPLASLQSNLDDIAIVGHSVTVEVLQNCSSDALLKKTECHPITTKTELLIKKRGNVITKSTPKSRFSMRTRSQSQSRVKIQHMISGHLMLGSSFLRSKSSRSKHKKSGFSQRKIRSLSSITIDRRRTVADRKLVVEKIVSPAIACIPLRLVFSRINEALNNSARPSSCI
ncbi:Tudor/PWWP/MBT domain-containing protein [Dioscorea alata]|uniref:Tudor/PWWP/MBT domain-containing protein n=1 Tax=Dioscorea alata TaxID=55571 RepID=A0ACB7WF62_DIOAL|nr:Tudor/PWWP/MBT domain-containing protein [Dioscorea alata]